MFNPEPDDEEEDIEETAPGNRLTLDNLVEGFRLFKLAFDLSYDMGTESKANGGRRVVAL